MKGIFRYLPVIAAFWAGVMAHGQAPLDIDFFGTDYRPPAEEETTVTGTPTTVAMPVKGSCVQLLVPEYEHVLRLQDGQRLRGRLAGITPGNILWRRKDASEVLSFPRENVRSVVIVPPTNIAGGVPGISALMEEDEDHSTLKLAGGDWIKGLVTSTDGETFSIQRPPHAGLAVEAHPLTIPRSAIEWMSFNTQADPVASLRAGAMALEGWITNKPLPPPPKAGRPDARAVPWIAHELSGERFEIALEVAEENEEGLRLWLMPPGLLEAWAESPGPRGNPQMPGTFLFRFTKKKLQWLIGSGGASDLKVLPLPAEAQAEAGPVRYRVLFDGQDRHIVFMRNGRQLVDWPLPGKNKTPDAEEIVSGITALGLDYDQASGKDPRGIRRIDVLPWDGQPPLKDSGAEQELHREKEPPRAGHLEGVRENELVFSGRKMPIAAGTYVKFPPAPATPPINPEALISLRGSGEISIAELTAGEDRIGGRTAFAPAFAIRMDDVQSIRFPQHAPEPEAARDLLVFRNGDELAGTLVAAAAGSPLRWKLATGQDVDFQTDRIAGVRLRNADKVKPTAAIELRSGERLRGAVAAFDEHQLRWSQSLLGELTVERGHLWRLYPDARQSLRDGGHDPATWLRESPDSDPSAGIENIVLRTKAWLPLDGRFILRAREDTETEEIQGPYLTIDKDLDRFELRVDLMSPEIEMCGLSIEFSGAGGAEASMELTSELINLQGNSPKSPNGGEERQIPMTPKEGAAQNRWHVSAFVNRPAGTIDFAVNGRPAGRLGESAANRLPGIGQTAGIGVTADPQSHVVLSQVAVIPWSGQLPVPGVPEATTTLSNGDVASGAPAALVDGHWRLESDIGPLELPLKNVQAVEFGGEMKPVAAAARLRLIDGSALLVDRFEWSAGNLTAHHAIFGDLKLPASAIAEFIFKPAPVQPVIAEEAKKGGPKGNPRPDVPVR